MSTCTKIVVGVDGSAGARTAVRYAATEAVRANLQLELLYVVPEPSPVAATMDPLYPLSVAEMRHAGWQILDEAARVAGAVNLAPVPRLTLEEGDRSSVLRTHARPHTLLVLGNDRPPWAKRLFTGSVLTTVAGRSEGPVTVVPDTWTAEVRGRVVVGVARSEESSGLLWRAFQCAAERDATLDVLHAWELRIRYGQGRVSESDLEAWHRDVTDALRTDLDECARSFPQVDYHVVTRNQQPAAALAEATQEADVMLIARRPHRLGGHHLGSTGRALLEATRCPVQVVAPSGEPVWERDADLERDGSMLADHDG